MMEQIIQDNSNFIYYLFNLTAGSLYALSFLSGLSYQFWNILIWFGLLPALWIAMISRKTTMWMNVLSPFLFAYLFAVHSWAIWFDKAVVLLNLMSDFFQSDYRSMSVYVCVFIPLAISSLLCITCLSRRKMKWGLGIMIVISLLAILFFPISTKLLKHYGMQISRMKIP
jgi:hypothetical protein